MATEFQIGAADKPIRGNTAVRKIITAKAVNPVKPDERAASCGRFCC